MEAERHEHVEPRVQPTLVIAKAQSDNMNAQVQAQVVAGEQLPVTKSQTESTDNTSSVDSSVETDALLEGTLGPSPVSQVQLQADAEMQVQQMVRTQTQSSALEVAEAHSEHEAQVKKQHKAEREEQVLARERMQAEMGLQAHGVAHAQAGVQRLAEFRMKASHLAEKEANANAELQANGLGQVQAGMRLDDEVNSQTHVTAKSTSTKDMCSTSLSQVGPTEEFPGLPQHLEVSDDSKDGQTAHGALARTTGAERHLGIHQPTYSARKVEKERCSIAVSKPDAVMKEYEEERQPVIACKRGPEGEACVERVRREAEHYLCPSSEEDGQDSEDETKIEEHQLDHVKNETENEKSEVKREQIGDEKEVEKMAPAYLHGQRATREVPSYTESYELPTLVKSDAVSPAPRSTKEELGELEQRREKLEAHRCALATKLAHAREAGRCSKEELRALKHDMARAGREWLEIKETTLTAADTADTLESQGASSSSSKLSYTAAAAAQCAVELRQTPAALEARCSRLSQEELLLVLTEAVRDRRDMRETVKAGHLQSSIAADAVAAGCTCDKDSGYDGVVGLLLEKSRAAEALVAEAASLAAAVEALRHVCRASSNGDIFKATMAELRRRMRLQEDLLSRMHAPPERGSDARVETERPAAERASALIRLTEAADAAGTARVQALEQAVGALAGELLVLRRAGHRVDSARQAELAAKLRSLRRQIIATIATRAEAEEALVSAQAKRMDEATERRKSLARAALEIRQPPRLHQPHRPHVQAPGIAQHPIVPHMHKSGVAGVPRPALTGIGGTTRPTVEKMQLRSSSTSRAHKKI